MKSMAGKMTALLIAASAVPLVVAALVERGSVRRLFNQSSSELLSARAEQLAWQLDLLHDDYSKTVRRLARLPEVMALAQSPSTGRAQLTRPWLEDLLNSDPYFRKLIVINLSGIVIASTNEAAVGKSFAFRSYFQEARQGRNAISDIFFSILDGGEVPVINYAFPIPGKSGEPVGVLALSVAVNAFWDPMHVLNGRTGSGSFAVLYDQHGVRLGHSADPAQAFHPAGPLDPITLGNFVATRRFLGRTRELMEAIIPAPDEFERARGPGLSDQFESLAPQGDQLVASRRLTVVPWTVFLSVPKGTQGRAAQDLIRTGLFTCLAVLALAIAAHAVVVRRALRPIREMTLAAAEMARGNYDARLERYDETELDELARSFDEMAEGLSVARAGLEDKVRERTQALEAMNVEMARRNGELAERSEELARHRYREQAKGRALAVLTADAELDSVIGAALGELAGPVGAATMICYQVDGTELLPIASYAASESARTTRVPVAGLAAEALRKGSIELLQSVPADLDLRFDCLVATGRPRAVVMIPLSVSRRPTGLLVVGALAPLTPEAITTLSDLASPLALTMARRTLIDHTERIARELAQRNEELHRQASALEEQGEELKAQKQELSLKNVEVQRADRLKSEFLANMSHELRTPLNAVIGFSELLLDDRKHLSAAQSEWVVHIQESGGHLLTLINSVLDLAKIEAGRMTLSVETVAPGDAVAAACALIRPAARRKNIALSTVESDAGPVKTDRGALQQVLLNLLSNAVKFSPEKGAIEVGFEPASGGVRFWVKDHGPGVEAKAQKGLFEPFFQVESPLVKRHEGTGLGLAISRRLVEQQGGTIGVDSVPGKGSTFFFTLPLAEEPAQLAESEAQAGPPPAFGGDGPLVLVVDDHRLNRELARELLERRGCRVLLAADGVEGLSMARSRSPKLIFLDLAMPKKDGFTVAGELKADPLTAHIPLVALTALAMRGDDERARPPS